MPAGGDFDADNEVLAALRKAGAPSAVIDAARRSADEAGDFEVWPENWETLKAFLALGRRWTWVAPAMSDPVRVGIPATEIEATLRLLQVRGPARRAMFEDLLEMEQAALEVFNAGR